VHIRSVAFCELHHGLVPRREKKPILPAVSAAAIQEVDDMAEAVEDQDTDEDE
jgi:hypothetical protein